MNELRYIYVIKLVKQQTMGVDTMFTWSWSSSIDGWATLNQYDFISFSHLSVFLIGFKSVFVGLQIYILLKNKAIN